MKGNQRPLLLDRGAALKAWLDGRLRREAAVHFFEGVIFLFFGVVLLGIVSCLPVMVVFAMVGWDFDFNTSLSMSAVFLFLLVISLFKASRLRFGMDYSGDRKTSAGPMFASVAELLLAAPAQLLNSGEAFGKCLRLLRLARRDLDEVAAILLWVFQKGRKALTREIRAALPGVNIVRILPQLQDIPGVIWLPHDREIIILAEELRAEIAALLRETPMRASAPAPDEPPQEPAREASAGEDRTRPASPPNEEIYAWYAALDLPPFAPLAAVRKKYRQLAKLHHPDTAPSARGGRSGSPDERIKQINAAYHNILRNSAR